MKPERTVVIKISRSRDERLVLQHRGASPLGGIDENSKPPYAAEKMGRTAEALKLVTSSTRMTAY